MNEKQQKILEHLRERQTGYEKSFISNPNSRNYYRQLVESTISVKIYERIFEGKTMDKYIGNENNPPITPFVFLMTIRKTTEKEIREKYDVPDFIHTVYSDLGLMKPR